MISYQIENNNLVLVMLKDGTTLDDVLNFLDEFESLKDLDKEIKLLYDVRGVELGFGADGLKVISKKAADVTKDYISIRTAFLVDEPKATAFTYIFSHITPSERTTREVFSSESAAMAWLNEY